MACLWNEQALDAALEAPAYNSSALSIENCGEWRPSNMETGAPRMAVLQYQPAAAPFVGLLESFWPGGSWVPAVQWQDYRAPVLTVYLTPDHGWRLYEDAEGTYGGDYNAAFARVWKEWRRENPRTVRSNETSEIR